MGVGRGGSCRIIYRSGVEPAFIWIVTAYDMHYAKDFDFRASIDKLVYSDQISSSVDGNTRSKLSS